MKSQLRKTILAITLIGTGSISTPALAISTTDKIFTGFFAGIGCASAIGAYIFGKKAYFAYQTSELNQFPSSFANAAACVSLAYFSLKDAYKRSKNTNYYEYYEKQQSK